MREVRRGEDFLTEEELQEIYEYAEYFDGGIKGISLEEYLKLKEKGIQFNPFNRE